MLISRKYALGILIGLVMTATVWADSGSQVIVAQDDTTPRNRPATPSLQAPAPPCQFVDWVPFHNEQTTCVEVVYDHIATPEAAPELMGLAFGPDGTLYMARTALGEIWAMRDRDHDNFMDDTYQVSTGLQLPIALTFYDGSLYVLTVDTVVRLDETDDGRFNEQTVLVEGLSGDTGFWPGGLGIGPDGRLYVSLGASCDLCDTGDAIRAGMLVSYTLDGSDRRIEATGLRNPKDFAWEPDTGELWIVDSAQVAAQPTPGDLSDELDRVVAGADYGFPYCYGDQIPNASMSLPQTDYCAHTRAPSFSFAYQSTPSGIAFYPSDSFPLWKDDLVVALSGSWNLPEPAGYAVQVVEFEGGAPHGKLDRLVPDSPPDSIYAWYPLARYSLFGVGLFPYHPVDVVIDAQGWIYVSLQEGRIFRFRPLPKS